MPRGRPKERPEVKEDGVTLEKVKKMRDVLEEVAKKTNTTPYKVGADLIKGLEEQISIIMSAMV